MFTSLSFNDFRVIAFMKPIDFVNNIKISICFHFLLIVIRKNPSIIFLTLGFVLCCSTYGKVVILLIDIHIRRYVSFKIRHALDCSGVDTFLAIHMLKIIFVKSARFSLHIIRIFCLVHSMNCCVVLSVKFRFNCEPMLEIVLQY